MHDFKESFRKTHVQSGMTLPECMTLPENFPTTKISVKLMHDCTAKLDDHAVSNFAIVPRLLPYCFQYCFILQLGFQMGHENCQEPTYKNENDKAHILLILICLYRLEVPMAS